MSSSAIDYTALAKQAGAVSSQPAGAVDYEALAKQAGAVSSVPAPATGDQPATFSGVASLMGSQAKRAMGAAWDTISSTPGLVLHPVDAMQKAFAYTADAVGRVQNATSHGDTKEAILSGLGAIPLAGPAAEQIAREIDGGNYAEAIGHAAALRVLSEAPKAIPAVVKGTVGAAKTVAAIPAAVRAAAAADPELAAAGSRLGSNAIKAVPGGSNVAAGVRAAQDLRTIAARLRTPTPVPEAPAAQPQPTGLTIQPAARIATPPVAAPTPASYAPPVTSTTPLPAAPAAPAPPFNPYSSTSDPAALTTRAAQGQTALARPNPLGTMPPAPAPEAAANSAPQSTAPEVTTIPPAKTVVPPEVFKAKAQVQRGAVLAKLMNENDIPHADAVNMTADQQAMLAKAAGITPPSPVTWAEALYQLHRMETTKPPSPALAAALKKPGALDAATRMADALK